MWIPQKGKIHGKFKEKVLYLRKDAGASLKYRKSTKRGPWTNPDLSSNAGSATDDLHAIHPCLIESRAQTPEGDFPGLHAGCHIFNGETCYK